MYLADYDTGDGRDAASLIAAGESSLPENHRHKHIVCGIHLVVSGCAGFDWVRVNFLHSSLYGAMFWICDQKSVDNTGMF